MNAFIDCPEAPLDPPEDGYEEDEGDDVERDYNREDDAEYDLLEDK